MRKILIIVAAAVAGLTIVPQAQAHDDRVGVFVVGAITGAVIGQVLSSHGDSHHHYDRGPRVVEHHYYESRRPARVIHHRHYERPRHHWKKSHHHGGHGRHVKHGR